MNTKIGFNINHPLLLPTETLIDINIGKEEEEWAKIVKNKGYHEKKSITMYVA
jgi:hypothetical protein